MPLEPLVLDCELSYSHVQTNNPGEVDELVFSRSGQYDLVEVEDPARWVVEYCGRTTVTTGTGLTPAPACGDANVECTGTEPPSTHCELALPKFTGTSILATCSTVTRIQRTGVDSTTTITHESIRLVPR